MDTAAPEQCLCKLPLHFGSLCSSMCVMFAVLNSSTAPQHAFSCSHPEEERFQKLSSISLQTLLTDETASMRHQLVPNQSFMSSPWKLSSFRLLSLLGDRWLPHCAMSSSMSKSSPRYSSMPSSWKLSSSSVDIMACWMTSSVSCFGWGTRWSALSMAMHSAVTCFSDAGSPLRNLQPAGSLSLACQQCHG